MPVTVVKATPEATLAPTAPAVSVVQMASDTTVGSTDEILGPWRLRVPNRACSFHLEFNDRKKQSLCVKKAYHEGYLTAVSSS